MDGSGAALRRGRVGAAGAQHGLARRRTRLQKQQASRQGDLDHVVADAQEDDCSGKHRQRICPARLQTTDGVDGRSRAPQSYGHDRDSPVLQSSPQDENAGGLSAMSAGLRNSQLRWASKSLSCASVLLLAVLPTMPAAAQTAAQIDLTKYGARAVELLQQFLRIDTRDRKSTRLNSSHGYISYAVFCLKKK